MKKTLVLIALLFPAFCSFSQGSNGLVAHWGFNGNANDASGHNLNGIVTSATLTPGYNGIANTAYLFNGSSSHIDIPNNALLNVDSLSMCILVKPTGYYAGTCQVNCLMAKGDETAQEFYELKFEDNDWDSSCTTATLSHEVFDAGIHTNAAPTNPSWYSNNDTVTLNNWFCIVCTYSHDTIHYYVDGTLRQTIYSPDNYGTGTSPLGIGYFPNGSGIGYPYWFKGAIDDIRLYSRALSAAEAVQYCDSAKLNPSDVTQLNFVIPEILIYPNPAHNSISVQLPYNTPGSLVQIFNTLGQIIATIRPNSSSVSIDLSILPVGMYYIKANCDGLTLTQRFLKQ